MSIYADTDTFEKLESEVRWYCRLWPATFTRAKGHCLYDADGREYCDFFSGAGALNYGHNHPALKERLLEYLGADQIVHSLDMYTEAKRDFLERFQDTILEPRGYDYRVQLPGPTGTNAVESALKLARKVTGRDTVVGFTNAFHGMTLGSLSVTGNSMKRDGAGVTLSHATSMPYDGYLGDDSNTVEYLAAYLEDSGSGLDLPAAVIVETVQGEGGLNCVSSQWLRDLADVCREYEILLILDDIQAGCGRTGSFFSFEEAGIEPDIVCLAKSLSGYGLPLAATLMKPELDEWDPGEHNGTFRGFNPAFVTATAALETFWRDDRLISAVRAKSAVMRNALGAIMDAYPELEGEHRGRGLIQGVACAGDLAEKITAAAFERGQIMETSGPEGNIVKLMPPLTIGEDDLMAGLGTLEGAVADTLEVERRGTHAELPDPVGVTV